MKIITAIMIVAALVMSVAAGADADEVRALVGQVYGLDGWDRVEKSGEREVRRSWIWRVKDRTVTFRDEAAGTEPFTYSLDDVGETPTEELKAVDHRFINDQYWLLFALHVAWDTDATVIMGGEELLPIGEGTGIKVTVQYPEEGGYTPGDAYDIYMDSGMRITQWVFRQGGQAEPSLATTWEDQQNFGPLLIATRFKSGDGSFELWFSDVEVKTTGGGD